MPKSPDPRYVEVQRKRYKKAVCYEKGYILDEVVRDLGLHRKSAIRLLNRRPQKHRPRPGPRPRYDSRVLKKALIAIWLASELPCSRRLRGVLRIWLPFYERHHGPLPAPERRLLLAMSRATIDRLLHDERPRLRRQRHSGTRPGGPLRTQIPIRAGAWRPPRPGTVETDTVAHCGERISGSFVWSLTFTDLWSGWTEVRAVWNRTAVDVVARLREVEGALPFALSHLHADNGTEFMNEALFGYLRGHEPPVAFTRSRPSHKNDNAHVEEKQWTHVRQLLGYERIDDQRLVEKIDALYAGPWSALTNYFLPTLKLRSKERVGSRVRRRHEKQPRTPCERLLASGHVGAETKDRLRRRLSELDPFELRAEIERGLREIFPRKTPPEKRARNTSRPVPSQPPNG